MVRLDKITRAAVDALEDIKARDIAIFDVKKMTAYFDKVVVASGDSNRQCRALADHVQVKVKAAGGKIYGVEGETSGEWLLVDIGSAVVHIMQPAIRQYYNLEELWASPEPIKAPKAKKLPKATKKVSKTVKSSATSAQSASGRVSVARKKAKPSVKAKKSVGATTRKSPAKKTTRVVKTTASVKEKKSTKVVKSRSSSAPTAKKRALKSTTKVVKNS